MSNIGPYVDASIHHLTDQVIIGTAWQLTEYMLDMRGILRLLHGATGDRVYTQEQARRAIRKSL